MLADIGLLGGQEDAVTLETICSIVKAIIQFSKISFTLSIQIPSSTILHGCNVQTDRPSVVHTFLDLGLSDRIPEQFIRNLVRSSDRLFVI